MAGRKNKKGFTLVEILIVVVILGILAAIVVPQFTNASQSAKSSSATSLLQAIRSQLELFQVQHNGYYPTLDAAGTWAIMINKSGSTDTGPGAGSTTGIYGPYLQQAPKNPFVPTTVNTAVTTSWNGTTLPAVSAKNETCGWYYQQTTGKIAAAGFTESTGQMIP